MTHRPFLYMALARTGSSVGSISSAIFSMMSVFPPTIACSTLRSHFFWVSCTTDKPLSSSRLRSHLIPCGKDGTQRSGGVITDSLVSISKPRRSHPSATIGDWQQTRRATIFPVPSLLQVLRHTIPCQLRIFKYLLLRINDQGPPLAVGDDRPIF